MTHPRLAPCALACALALSACGGSEAPPRVSTSGTVNGAPFEAKDATVTLKSFQGGSSGAALRLTTAGDACAQGGHTKGELALTVLLVTLDSGVMQMPTAPGAFGVVDTAANQFPTAGNAAFVVFETADQSCAKAELQGASGRVTIARLNLATGGEVAGDLDVILQNGNRVRGTFASGICPTPAAGTPAPACE